MLFEELQAWRFVDKVPTDKTAQLNWAILEEKRRIVRTLIQKVVIGKHVGNNERWIESHLTFKMPVPTEDFLDSSDQSLDYINSWAKVTVTSSDIDTAAEKLGIN